MMSLAVRPTPACGPRPQSADIIGAQHRRDAGRFESRVRQLGFDAIREYLHDDEIHTC